MKETTEDARIYVLAQERPAMAVVKLGVPLIAGMCIMVLYNLVDTYFIGLLHDDYQLAAVNLAYPVMMVMVALSNMVGTGASSLIARCLGAGDTEGANRTLACGFVLTLIDSALVCALGLALLTPIVSVLGAHENTFSHTASYVRILLLGSLPIMGNYTFGQLLRGEGSVRLSIVGMVVGTLTNIALDPLLIFGFGLRVQGAALATVGGNTLGMAASIAFYLRGRTLLRPRAQQARPRAATVREIFWVGVPATLETLLTSAAYVVNNNLAIGYGELTVAATGIAQKTLSLGSYIYQGFAAGTQPIMGYNYGAKNYERMVRVLRAGICVVTLTELVVMTLFMAAAPALVGLFTTSSEVIETGAKALRALACILPFVGATSMSRMSFQAMGKPLSAFSITLVRQLILYVPLLLVLNDRFGFDGMIWAQPLTEAIMMAASVGLLLHTIRTEDMRSHTSP